jgi:ankyrin repeat protein
MPTTPISGATLFKPIANVRGIRATAAVGLLSLAVAIVSFAAPPRTLVDLAREGKRDSVIAAITSPDVDVNVKSPDGATSLMWAIYNNDMELARALLKAGARANVISSYGASALSEAIKHNDLDMVRTLLDAGADVNSMGTDNQTALMLAISVGPQAQKIAELLIQRGADVNAIETFRGQNALMWAAAGNMPDIVDQIIAKGATNINMRAKSDDWARMVTSEPRAQFGTRHTGGLTALLYATRAGCLRCAQALVKAGAEIEKPNPDGITPLLNALDNGKYDVANFLLDQGANPRTWDMNGRTPIYSAVDRKVAAGGAAGGRGGGPGGPGAGGRGAGPGAGGPPGAAGGPRGAGGPPGGPGAVTAGGPGGARPAAAGPVVTPMAVINRLLDMGVDVNHELTRKRPYGQGRARFTDYDMRGGVGPLFNATMKHDHEVMEALIKHGAEVDLTNVFQMTPLMHAAGMSGTGAPSPMADAQATNAMKSIDILLNAGADINARILDSRTHTAKLMSYVAGRDQEGRTALIGAADDGSAKIVQYLIDKGADLTVKDATNKTSLDLSREPCPPPGLQGNETQKATCERLMAARAATEKVLVAAMTKAGIPVPPALPPAAMPAGDAAATAAPPAAATANAAN